MSNKNSRLVYSSEKGRIKPQTELNSAFPTDGVVRVRRETKGRGGKTVTTIFGVPLAEPELKQLTKDLKTRCGTGGSTKDGIIIIQGDHADKLVDELKKRGYHAKRTGG